MPRRTPWSRSWLFPRRAGAGRLPPPPVPPPAPAPDPLLRWKAHRWFDCLLADPGPRGDGRLTFADYELAAARVARAFRQRPGSRAHRRLHERFRKLWRLLDPAGDGALDREGFAAALDRSAARERRALLAAVNGLCCALVDLADTDGDNVLAEREYRVLLGAAFHLGSEHDLRTAYRTLDRDGSGVLEHNELHEAFVEFFTSTDPEAQGNWLLGAPHPGGPHPGGPQH